MTDVDLGFMLTIWEELKNTKQSDVDIARSVLNALREETKAVLKAWGLTEEEIEKRLEECYENPDLLKK